MQLPSARVRSLFALGKKKKKKSKFTQLLLPPHSEQISLTEQMRKLFPDICVWLFVMLKQRSVLVLTASTRDVCELWALFYEHAFTLELASVMFSLIWP